MSNPDSLALLRQAILQSNISTTRFAELVLMRDPRTLRRWLKGESPIPKAVRDFLLTYTVQRSTVHHLDGDPHNNELDNLRLDD